MGVERIHKDDIGTVVTLLVLQAGTDDVEDISDATVMKAKIKRKDGSVVTVDCAFVTDGSDGKMKFTSDANTFNIAGPATIQGYIETATKKHHTTQYSFIIHDVLA